VRDPDKRPHGQKATGQKATATHLRVYCPAYKCNINTSLPGPYTTGHFHSSLSSLSLTFGSIPNSQLFTRLFELIFVRHGSFWFSLQPTTHTPHV